MKINPGLLVLQIFAVIASYLMLSVTFASAYQINIFGDTDQATASIQGFGDLMDKEFTFEYDYARNAHYMSIKLESRSDSAQMRKVYFYVCRDYNPVQCILRGDPPHIGTSPSGSIPVHEEEMKWSDVSTGGSANFMAIVKMDVEGRTVWTGSWDHVEKTGSGIGPESFEHESYDVDRLNLYLDPGVNPGPVKNYIEARNRIPSSYVNRSVFALVSSSTVDKLYGLMGDDGDVDPSGTDNPVFSTDIESGNTFEGAPKRWSFVFGGDGDISNPVIFYSTGEDLPSGEGDIGGASLAIDDFGPQIITCESGQVISAKVHVENSSMISCAQEECYYTDFGYEIDGQEPGESHMTCQITDKYTYECEIPVSNLPACDAPGTSTITMYFLYDDGSRVSAGYPVTLKKPSPSVSLSDLSPNPFDCGIDSELAATITVSNPTSSSPVKEYTLDGSNYQTLDCDSPMGNSYRCRIPEGEICGLLNENLDLYYRFTFGEVETNTSRVNLMVTFPPPSMAVDHMTTQIFTAGESADSTAYLHVNYPDSVTFSGGDFEYRYLDGSWETVTCAKKESFPDIEHYECPLTVDVPAGTTPGVRSMEFRLNGFDGEGNPETLRANTFMEVRSPPPDPDLSITYAGRLDCISDSTLTVRARADNILEDPGKQEYSTGSGYSEINCQESNNVFTCSIPADDICQMKKLGVTLNLRFTYPSLSDPLVSKPYKIYVDLPKPSFHILYVAPDPMTKGKTTDASVQTYIKYPSYVSSSPSFRYSYMDKSDQTMSCTKDTDSGSADKDFYSCTASFDIPSGYSADDFPLMAKIKGTDLISEVYQVDLIEATAGPQPDIQKVNPDYIEGEAGNSTAADIFVRTVDFDEAGISSVSLSPSGWIRSGTCERQQPNYYACTIEVDIPSGADAGDQEETLKMLVSDGSSSHDVTHPITVSVIPEAKGLDIQAITPDSLYCPGHPSSNPQQVQMKMRLTETTETPSILQEDIKFNSVSITGTSRYCSTQGYTVSCTIPVDKFLSAAGCDQMSEGDVGNMPLNMNFSLKLPGQDTPFRAGLNTNYQVYAAPVTPYIEFVDNQIDSDTGYYGNNINCLESNSIALGQKAGDFIVIQNAELLHEPDGELSWSFNFNAQDASGKLTKGRGISPTEESVLCELKNSASVGAHREEMYKCSLYVDPGFFQRCDDGSGTVELVATSKSTGKQARGSFKVYVKKGTDPFDIHLDVNSYPKPSRFKCHVNTAGGSCGMEYSMFNATVSLRNREDGDISDLEVYDSQITLADGKVNAHSSMCRKVTQEQASPDQSRYICTFRVPSTITISEEITDDPDQTFGDVPLGTPNLTMFYRYANGLVYESRSKEFGTITIEPELNDNLRSMLDQRRQADKVYKEVEGIFQWLIRIAAGCAVCLGADKLWGDAGLDKEGDDDKDTQDTSGDGDDEEDTGDGDDEEGTNGGEEEEGTNGDEQEEEEGTNGGEDEEAGAETAGAQEGETFGIPYSEDDYQPETGGIGFTDYTSDECQGIGATACESACNDEYPEHTGYAQCDPVKAIERRSCEGEWERVSEGEYSGLTCDECYKDPGDPVDHYCWCCVPEDSEEDDTSGTLPGRFPAPDENLEEAEKNVEDVGDIETSGGRSGLSKTISSIFSKKNVEAAGTVALIVTAVFLVVLIINTIVRNSGGTGIKEAPFSWFSKEEEEDKYTSALKEGFTAGLAFCVLPRLIYSVPGIGGGFEDVMEFVSKTMASTCKFLMGAPQLIMLLLRLVMRWLQFRMCLDMARPRSISTGGSAAYQTMAQAGEASRVMQSMTQCFSQLDGITNDAFALGWEINNRVKDNFAKPNLVIEQDGKKLVSESARAGGAPAVYYDKPKVELSWTNICSITSSSSVRLEVTVIEHEEDGGKREHGCNRINMQTLATNCISCRQESSGYNPYMSSTGGSYYSTSYYSRGYSGCRDTGSFSQSVSEMCRGNFDWDRSSTYEVEFRVGDLGPFTFDLVRG